MLTGFCLLPHPRNRIQDRRKFTFGTGELVPVQIAKKSGAPPKPCVHGCAMPDGIARRQCQRNGMASLSQATKPRRLEKAQFQNRNAWMHNVINPSQPLCLTLKLRAAQVMLTVFCHQRSGGEGGGRGVRARGGRRADVRWGYREERGGRPVEAQPGRPVQPFPPSPAVTQHLPVAGGVLSRIVKVARGRKTRPNLGSASILSLYGA